ncbi:MAG: hypothetical protein LBO69_00300 [Ignavibacteria bacterium]|nr:hypothetical protein [Ignavibacteria bacterium]
MKKVLLIVAIIFATTITASAQFSGGSGTQAAPYQITSKADMEALADSIYNNNLYSSVYASKYYIVMNDITDSVTKIIGRALDSTGVYNFSFNGIFDGCGHKITFSLNDDTGRVAPFGSNTGTIKNLIIDGKITGLRCSGVCFLNDTGAIISNCTNASNVESAVGGINQNAAGVVNVNFGIIDYCSNTGTITGQYAPSGGICYDIRRTGVISNCTNIGTIQGNMAAGIVARNEPNVNPQLRMTITKCVNSGLIKGSSYTGGIIAVISACADVLKCINTNELIGNNHLGAIVGFIPFAVTGYTITDCFYDIQMCKYKAVNNQDHPGVTGLPTHLLMEELAK